jgi:sugar O-acyltransferase (sialic acid O-acetyltransferase NeuD family)
MEDLFIFPFNGNALEALSCLQGQYNFLGFIDDTPEKQGLNPLGFHVYGRGMLKKNTEARVLAVPGSPTSYRMRKQIIAGLELPGERWATLIHPSASVSPLARIGRNVLVMAGVVITSNGVIGDHVCVLPNSVLHHDSVIGDYTLIGSNVTVAGNTSIGGECYIGSGTSIINGIQIADGCLVGMGSNVIRSLTGNSKAVGNPARVIS